jgi:hypothetical protein
MNNPWSSLIAALSGQRISTPSTWPVREVHRLFDVRPKATPSLAGAPGSRHALHRADALGA